MFLVVTVLILIAVIATLAYPFWRREANPFLMGQQAEMDQERVDLELEREIVLSSLSELEVEREREKFSPEDYERLKATDERRLLQILEKLDALASARPARLAATRTTAAPTMHWAGTLAIALLVVAGSVGIYSYLGWVQQQRLRMAQAQMGGNRPDPREMVVRLEARLRDNPNDLEGQIMAGRSYMALERPEDAKKAWTKVLELDPTNAEGHFNLGVMLLTDRKIDDPKIFQEALGHFDIAVVKLPQEPALLWYRGIALVHLKRFAEADKDWTAAYQNLQPGSEDAGFVRQSLQQLRAGNPPLF